jgi:Cu+-exporting ATPase
MAALIVTILGIALIVGIFWFFFLSPSDASEQSTKILVSGGYKPKTIILKSGIETTLTFLRTDNNSCLEEIVIPDLGIKEFLPLNEEIFIKVRPPRKGIYDIHCGMNMFHGTIKAI